jgi:3-hydroxyacyl-CoA dehydrogenase
MYEINKACVIGAGTMGLGIAGQLANAGIDVLLLDLPSEGDDRNAICNRAIERLLDKRQPGLLHKDKLDHISIGNIEDDLEKLDDVDWIAEAVVERLDIKKALYRQIDAVRKSGSIVSSNTSTIPISMLVEDMPARFRSEFAITHFFNPVRFMRLLEIVRGKETRAEVIECLERLNESRMGKGIVVCNDTPGFLGNRVGVFAIQTALHAAFEMGLKPEEADALFGRPMGVPKTGVFGLYDLIGIDLMSDVASSLESILPPEDPFHQVSGEIPTMVRMIDEGRLGNKGTQGGFYRMVRPDGGAQDQAPSRQTLDFERFEYRAFDRSVPEVASRAEQAGDICLLIGMDRDAKAGQGTGADADRESESRYTDYAWKIVSDTLCYAAALVPVVNESLVSIDDAMKLGYNWLQGPFEMMDVIGVDRFIERLQSENRDIPDFLKTAAGQSFYRVADGELQYLRADGSYRNLRRSPGVIRFSEERRKLSPLKKNRAASYYALDHDIGLVEFHSKANTLDSWSMQLLAEAIEHASSNFQGIIVHNDAAHFSCGVNLSYILAYIENDDLAGLDQFLDHFQQTGKALKNSPIPAVGAPSGLSLGGGFEVVTHTDKAIFHANSVTGLVETLVGVVPGGGGVKELLYRWNESTGDPAKAAWETFMTVGYGKTAGSPLEAEPLKLFRKGTDDFVMNRDRLLSSAIAAVMELSPGYRPVPRVPLQMAGRAVQKELLDWLERKQADGDLTPHDVTTATQVAMIVTGGDVDQGTLMSENEILDLERKGFAALAATPETRARLQFMLKYGAPLRN